MDSLSRESEEPCTGCGDTVFFRWGQRAESRGVGGRPDPAVWAGQAVQGGLSRGRCPGWAVRWVLSRECCPGGTVQRGLFGGCCPGRAVQGVLSRVGCLAGLSRPCSPALTATAPGSRHSSRLLTRPRERQRAGAQARGSSAGQGWKYKQCNPDLKIISQKLKTGENLGFRTESIPVPR